MPFMSKHINPWLFFMPLLQSVVVFPVVWYIATILS